MSLVERSHGKLGKLAALACAAGILGSSLTGCSRGVGASPLSAEDQAKAKAAYKKKFENYGVKAKAGKKSR
jgi:hypothetical protein